MLNLKRNAMRQLLFLIFILLSVLPMNAQSETDYRPFIEDGKIVLLDYKTDRVDSEDELTERYRLQLELYKRALEASTNKKVKEVYIYSFDLGSVIKL